MIQIGETTVSGIYVGVSPTEVVEVSEMHLGDSDTEATLIYSAIASCFGSGFWMDDQFWLDDDFWID